MSAPVQEKSFLTFDISYKRQRHTTFLTTVKSYKARTNEIKLKEKEILLHFHNKKIAENNTIDTVILGKFQKYRIIIVIIFSIFSFFIGMFEII